MGRIHTNVGCSKPQLNGLCRTQMLSSKLLPFEVLLLMENFCQTKTTEVNHMHSKTEHHSPKATQIKQVSEVQMTTICAKM